MVYIPHIVAWTAVSHNTAALPDAEEGNASGVSCVGVYLHRDAAIASAHVGSDDDVCGGAHEKAI